MKTTQKWITYAMITLSLTNCETVEEPIDDELKEDEIIDCSLRLGTSRLLRISQTNSDSSGCKYVTEDYEYDDLERVYKVVHPSYSLETCEIMSVTEYDVYSYNPNIQSQLIKIDNYNNNKYYGFLHFSETTFDYSEEGNLIQETEYYILVDKSWKTKYLYKEDTLIRKEKYYDKPDLQWYFEYEYDVCGRLSKELEYYRDSTLISYKEHFYESGHLVKIDEYGNRDFQHIEQRLMKYDEDDNLVLLQIIEEPWFFDITHWYIFYEYAEE